MEPICLRSGRAVHVRVIAPDDSERLTAAHARLSPETQYRRFHAIKPTLTRKDARYLVEIDGYNHVALVATPLDDPDRIVAVARFVRLPGDPTAAEFSIVIGDEFQGDRLGSGLFARLIDTATAVGIERFVAPMLADNPAAHALVERAGAASWRRLGSVDEVELALVPATALAA
jgi:RimJ/RimL family protein N-acetyltransferase